MLGYMLIWCIAVGLIWAVFAGGDTGGGDSYYPDPTEQPWGNWTPWDDDTERDTL